MSMINSQHPTIEGKTMATDSLPPRHTKHGKRKHEEEPKEQDRDSNKRQIRGKGFLYIQIILYTFLALIVAIIILYYYSNSQQVQNVVDEHLDPMDRYLNQQAQNGGSLPDQLGLSNEDDYQNQINGDEHREEDTHRPDPSSQDEEQTESGNRATDDEKEDEPPETPTSDEPKIIAVHTVQSGETLYSITMQYYKSKHYLDYLAEFNGIKDPTTDVKVGMKIEIPEIRN